MHTDYKTFRALGFKKFWMRNEGRNHWLPRFVTQAETAWVNTKTKEAMEKWPNDNEPTLDFVQ